MRAPIDFGGEQTELTGIPYMLKSEEENASLR